MPSSLAAADCRELRTPAPQAATGGSASALRVLQAEVQVKQTVGSAARLLTAAGDHRNFTLRAQQTFQAIGAWATTAAAGGTPAPAPAAVAVSRRLHEDAPSTAGLLDLGDALLIEELLAAVQAQVPAEQRVPLAEGALEVRRPSQVFACLAATADFASCCGAQLVWPNSHCRSTAGSSSSSGGMEPARCGGGAECGVPAARPPGEHAMRTLFCACSKGGQG